MQDSIIASISEVHKKILLDVFQTFVNICEEHNLRYFCCGGTAIGVVRHQGMIPWDDDIDILMPRPDYDKFIRQFSTLAIYDKYELVTADNNDNYYLPFAKMCNKNTTVLEYSDIPCVFGIFIDIFPLDGAVSDVQEREQNLKKFRRAANKLLILPKSFSTNIKTGLKRVLNFQLRTALNEFSYAVNKKKGRKSVLKDINSSMQASEFITSSFYGNFGGMWGIKEFGPKEWFEDHEDGIFEGISVRIPKGYNELLTQMYGTYMQLPPLEKRISHHHVAYLNLEKRVEIDEVLRIIKK